MFVEFLNENFQEFGQAELKYPFKRSVIMFDQLKICVGKCWRYNIQHNDTEHNDTQHLCCERIKNCLRRWASCCDRTQKLLVMLGAMLSMKLRIS